MPLSESVMEKAPAAKKLSRMHDRCDGCSAQAFITASRILMDENEPRLQELLFCGHHGRKYRAKLEDAGWEIQDNTDDINVKPSISANAE